MTGGVAVILGRIGTNFGAGMTGGMAYLYDPEGVARDYINAETLVMCPVTQDHWETELHDLIERHQVQTMSKKAETILQNWDREKGNFLQVCPKEMLAHLPHPIEAVETPSAVPAE